MSILPLNLVELLKHDRLGVRVQNPMIAAEIAQISVGNILMVSDLDLGELCPISHTRLQIQIIIDSVVVELFYFDAIFFRQ